MTDMLNADFTLGVSGAWLEGSGKQFNQNYCRGFEVVRLLS